MITAAHDRMRKSRTLLVYERPAWAPLAFKLEMIEDPKVGTAGTDGRKLWYAPEFVMSMKVNHLIFVFTHELMHCAFRHPVRMAGRHPKVWNIACDISINNILVFEEQMEAAPGALLEKKYLGWTPEKIYDELMANAEQAMENFPNPSPIFVPGPSGSGDGQKSSGQGQQKPKDKKDGSGSGKDSKDEQKDKQEGQGGGNGDKDKKDGQNAPEGQQDGQKGNQAAQDGGFGGKCPWDKDLKEDWESAVVAAQQLAKSRGIGSSWLDREVQKVVEPRFKLEKILSRIIGTGIGEDTSWKSPNRRFVSRGLHLPSIEKDKKEGVVVLDVSGSVSDGDVEKFIGMTLRLAKSKGIQKLRIIQCDYEISDDQTIKRASQYKKKRSACGGTSFKPPFELLKKEKKATWDTSFIIYLTDLQGDFPEVKPRIPTFWISTTPDLAAPFGTTYHWDRQTDRVTHVLPSK